MGPALDKKKKGLETKAAITMPPRLKLLNEGCNNHASKT
jgi:hypothetical protein